MKKTLIICYSILTLGTFHSCTLIPVLADDSPAAINPTFYLGSPLKIGNRTLSGEINRQDVQKLMDEKIPIGSPEPDAYEFLTLEEKRIRVETCREYLAAISQGAYAATTFDLSMESFFKLSCNTLKAIQVATPSRHSYLPSEVLSDFHHLPVVMLAGFNPDAAEQLREETQRGTHFNHYLQTGQLKIISQTPYELTVEYQGMQLSWTELLRADFNQDGLEDVLLFFTQHALKGTFRSYSNLLLQKQQETQNFYQISPWD